MNSLPLELLHEILQNAEAPELVSLSACNRTYFCLLDEPFFAHWLRQKYGLFACCFPGETWKQAARRYYTQHRCLGCSARTHLSYSLGLNSPKPDSDYLQIIIDRLPTRPFSVLYSPRGFRARMGTDDYSKLLVVPTHPLFPREEDKLYIDLDKGSLSIHSPALPVSPSLNSPSLDSPSLELSLEDARLSIPYHKSLVDGNFIFDLAYPVSDITSSAIIRAAETSSTINCHTLRWSTSISLPIPTNSISNLFLHNKFVFVLYGADLTNNLIVLNRQTGHILGHILHLLVGTDLVSMAFTSTHIFMAHDFQTNFMSLAQLMLHLFPFDGTSQTSSYSTPTATDIIPLNLISPSHSFPSYKWNNLFSSDYLTIDMITSNDDNYLLSFVDYYDSESNVDSEEDDLYLLFDFLSNTLTKITITREEGVGGYLDRWFIDTTRTIHFFSAPFLKSLWSYVNDNANTIENGNRNSKIVTFDAIDNIQL